jgi:hypothetical protein
MRSIADHRPVGAEPEHPAYLAAVVEQQRTPMSSSDALVRHAASAPAGSADAAHSSFGTSSGVIGSGT